MIPFIEDDEEGAATGGGESEEVAMDIDNKSDTYRAVLAEHKQLDEVWNQPLINPGKVLHDSL